METINKVKESKEKILSPKRKKKLMKKLERIKLNRSRGNTSYVDRSSYYEIKIQKLRENNVSLAKALSEERQSSKTWCDLVVSLKAELQESQEKYLKCKLRENSSDDDIISARVEKHIRDLALPLECEISKCFDNVLSLVENMTKVKQVLPSLLKVNTERLSRSRSSYGSNGSGSRPPLSRTPKSPRKNVVHPMVEGHVLQPAAIHIPRMSLEDKRRYRLHERTEIHEDEEMNPINEHIIVEEEPTSVEDSHSDEEQQSPSETRLNRILEGSHEENEDLVNSVQEESSSPNSRVEEAPSPMNNESVECDEQRVNGNEEIRVSLPKSQKVKSDKFHSDEEIATENKETKDCVLQREDPLEGSSWMHTKRRRQSKKKKSKSKEAELKRSSGMHFLVENSSDTDDDDDVSIPISLYPKNRYPKKIASEEINEGILSPSAILLLQNSSKISRRSKKKSSESNVSCQVKLETINKDVLVNRECIGTVKEREELEVTKLDTVESISDDVTEKESVNSNSNLNLELEMNSSKENLKNSSKENLNLTNDSHSSMEMTRCLNKDIIHDVQFNRAKTEKTEGDLKLDQTLYGNSKLNNLSEINDEQSFLQVKENNTSTAGDKVEQKVNSINVFDEGKVVKKTEKKTDQENNEIYRKKDNEEIPHSKTKRNKFFKKNSEESGPDEPVLEKAEKTPYDLSMMDATILDTILRKGKENIPPDVDQIINSDVIESSMKLKDLSVIVKDIMKTPLCNNLNNYDRSIKVKSQQSSESRSVSSTSAKLSSNRRKRKVGSFKSYSPCRQMPKKNRKLNLIPNAETSIDYPSDEDDAWYPSREQNMKRKKSCQKKSKSKSKKLTKIPPKKSPKGEKSNLTPPKSLKTGKCFNENNKRGVSEPISISKNVDEEEDKFKNGTNDANIMYTEILNSSEPTELNVEYKGDPLSGIYNEINGFIINNINEASNVISVKVTELSDEEPEVVAIVNNSLEENIKSRPRRAALKINSFKEPSLHNKLRQEVTGKKKCKKTSKKLSIKSC